ncbi:dihydrolipoyl dehydrogenase [uncultured Negativibacillus sp.]|uniref:dihydrolipoyl dehydrogenase n=1 Tax=uncultured Negativibacillus sp. TaxID=1980696 RepID=UPI0025E97AEE|nr:dihydrolipoyl dehydrogenase [uncultured Negativibacillus sp.]
MKQYQLIVIGAGPGGYEAAIRAAQLGLHTALIERRQVGGTCLNRGCIPTKTMLHSAQLYKETAHFELFGLHTENTSFDWAKIHQRKNDVVSKLRSGIEQLIKANKIDFFNTSASILSPHEVQLEQGEETTLYGDNILIATGSVPSRPPIPGLDLPGVVTSDELLDDPSYAQTDSLPKEILIIGGGVIGVEFASVFSSFGCKVTIVEALDRILSTMDREISQNLSMILKKRGVEIHTGAMVERLEQSDGKLVCHFTEKEKPQQISSQQILVAIGRRANTQGLFGNDFSVEMERGHIVTDESFRTSVDSIYAIGDVSAKIQLAHMASAQGICAAHIIAGKVPPINLQAVPGCIYTDPEIASVGLSEDEAKKQGIPVKKGKFIMSGNGRSIIDEQERGFIKVLAHQDTDVILGAQLMCSRATDIVSELSTAIVNGLTVDQLAAVIRPHPTFCEGVTEAVEDVHGMAIHLAPKKR